jgi:hypothetical protein
LPIAERGDAVERALDAGAVVLAEAADARDDVLEVFVGDRFLRELLGAAGVAGFGEAPEVDDDLE